MQYLTFINTLLTTTLVRGIRFRMPLFYAYKESNSN